MNGVTTPSDTAVFVTFVATLFALLDRCRSFNEGDSSFDSTQLLQLRRHYPEGDRCTVI